MGNTNVIKATKAAIKECPREIFNFYLITCVCIWSFSGVAKGFDEGMLRWPPNPGLHSLADFLYKLKGTLPPSL